MSANVVFGSASGHSPDETCPCQPTTEPWPPYRLVHGALPPPNTDHEHYWVDAPDDETGWFCTICRVTEHPYEGIHEDDLLTPGDQE